MLIAALLPHLAFVLCHLTGVQATPDHGPTVCEARVVVEDRAALPAVALELPARRPEPVDYRAPVARAESTPWALAPWLRSLRPLRHPWDVRCTGTAARCARPRG